MKARFIGLRDIVDNDLRSWQELAWRSVEPNPLYEPATLLPAAIHQENGGDIRLLVAEDDGGFRACIPVREIVRWRRAMPYPVLSSHVRRMLYLGTPLIDPSCGLEAVTAMLEALAANARDGGPHFYALEWTAEPVASLFRAAADHLHLPLVVYESFERGALVRSKSTEPPQFHRERVLEKHRRQMSRAVGSEPRFVDRGQDPSAIEDYLNLEASGYKKEIGLATVLVADELASFRDMCSRFAADGRLHLPTLEVAGEVLSMQVWLRAGRGILMIKTSYDEKWANYSPGRLLNLDAREYFYTHTDAEWFDTGTYANNETLLRMYPDRRRISTLVIGLDRSPRTVIRLRGALLLQRVHRWVLRSRQQLATRREQSRHPKLT